MQRVVPSEAQLRALVTRYFSSDVREAQVVHHHCNTHVYLTLEDATRAVVRICDGPYWTERAAQVEKFRREGYAWERFGQLQGVLVPRVLAIETDETVLPCPFLLLTYLPGSSMAEVFPTLAHEEQRLLLEELGELARRLHALVSDLTDLPGEMFPWTGHREDILVQLEILTRRGRITSAARARVEQWVERYASELATMDDDRVLLHGDFQFGNVLLERDGAAWHVSGLVDAELAGAGPRGRELRGLETFSLRGVHTPGLREAFLRGYGDGYTREEYKLAYVTHELDPDFLNEEFLGRIEASEGV